MSVRFKTDIRNNCGYTLVEALTTGTVVIILITICLKLYISFDHLRFRADEVLMTQSRVAELDSSFRKTLREPASLVDSFQQFNSSESLLILRHADGKTVSLVGAALNPEEFSVMQWRLIDNQWEISGLKTFAFDSPKFDFSIDEGRLIRLSFSSDSFRESRSLPDTITFYAAVSSGGTT